MKRMMGMRKIRLRRLTDESGVTLVELLAALVILTIVFMAFFTFFTQSATFTKHNSEKLTAVQVAEAVVADVRDNQSLDDLDEMAKRDGYTLTNGAYENTSTYLDYKVIIKAGTGPVSSLNKAVITVMSLTDVGIKGSSFTTEMYFEEVTP